jgi:phosphatidylserine/phosphatidylglycerophosphate/cardiolipin synthase-like enzyme
MSAEIAELFAAEQSLAVAGAEAANARTDDCVEWLIDNAVAYEAVVDALRRARTSVWISQLAFDADCEAYADDLPPTNLLDVLVRAKTTHALDVRILLNASILVNTVKPLRAALEKRGAPTIEVRGISRFPQLLHAKMIVVDGVEAFLLGSPLVNGYWDDDAHRPVDRRRPTRELGGRPLHDLSLRVRGSAVEELRALFHEWWTEVADEARTARPHAECADELAMPAETGAVSVTRTVPAGVSPRRPSGHMEILDSMLEGIDGAREVLYVEHQYLSARPVIRAIGDALDRSPALEVIALVNQNPDITAYRGWQNARLAESGLRDHPRFGLFALWSQARQGRALFLNQVFVHSKVIIADDAWATVGSANVDGVSLHSYGDDFESWLGQRVFGGVRNFDVNLELRGADVSIADSIAELRAGLWREHLGGKAAERALAGAPLHAWREQAARNVAALNAYTPARGSALTPTFVLPYSTEARPASQLADLGVHDRDDLDLRFEPGWLEVHCSPNWIRNMFA